MRDLAIGIAAFAGIWLAGIVLSALFVPLIPVFAIAAVCALAWWLVTPRRTHPRKRSTRG